jgi:hypothetical protein
MFVCLMSLCEQVCQWLALGRGFYLGHSVSSINKTDRHDITEILLKVALNTITLTQIQSYVKSIFQCFLHFKYNKQPSPTKVDLPVTKPTLLDSFSFTLTEAAERPTEAAQRPAVATERPTEFYKVDSSSEHIELLSALVPDSSCTRYNIMIICDKVCQWLAAGQKLSSGTLVSPSIKLTATI